jgi:hypothetical protein
LWRLQRRLQGGCIGFAKDTISDRSDSGPEVLIYQCATTVVTQKATFKKDKLSMKILAIGSNLSKLRQFLQKYETDADT